MVEDGFMAYKTIDGLMRHLRNNGIAIQGMTKEEAIDAISRDFKEKYQDTQMTVTLNGKKFQKLQFQNEHLLQIFLLMFLLN